MSAQLPLANSLLYLRTEYIQSIRTEYQNQNKLYCRYVYTYKELVFVTEAREGLQ